MKVKFCFDCKKLLSKMAYLIGTKRCKKCAKQGKLHSQYKGGKPKCKMCKKVLSHYKSKLCQKCYTDKMTKENHPNWKKGISFTRLYCKECKKLLCKSAYYSKVKRCKSCNLKFNKKTKYTKAKHHIDLNKNNNTKSNILILTNSKHGKIHFFAYRYLVKTKQIKKYIRWFFNQKG